MHIREKSEKLLKELFNEEAAPAPAADGGFTEKNYFVDKAVEILEQDGFSLFAKRNSMGPFSVTILLNEDKQEQAVIVYTDALAMVDDHGNEFSPLIYKGPIMAPELEPDFLVDFIAEHKWGDKTKSEGVKMDPLALPKSSAPKPAGM